MYEIKEVDDQSFPWIILEGEEVVARFSSKEMAENTKEALEKGEQAR